MKAFFMKAWRLKFTSIFWGFLIPLLFWPTFSDPLFLTPTTPRPETAKTDRIPSRSSFPTGIVKVRRCHCDGASHKTPGHTLLTDVPNPRQPAPPPCPPPPPPPRPAARRSWAGGTVRGRTRRRLAGERETGRRRRRVPGGRVRGRRRRGGGVILPGTHPTLPRVSVLYVFIPRN